ncbi:hypothetical protein GCM10016455_32510 [Aliiroseovarius zhejiangensis]|uniref:Secreted protein n=1 Tax=Aliiroseovarius zhejiangensis TaxID=1632025 RepID=A0ABQ3J8J3_9RHOB|nr:hypothetical protein [Aliiroseovarius zhejiangensis]GHF09107.1 hypothetical protein GCM10016455_32510 [Aliiroseovarius zhejiangensis]
MSLTRLLLVVMVALSASVSAAMDAGHAAVVEHSHAAMDDMADDQPVCCSESSERSQTCHALPALLPGAGQHDAAPATCEDVFFVAGLLLTGIEPSSPLDPPRVV